MTDADIEAVARAIFAADMPPGTNPDAQYPKGFDSPYETVSAWGVYEKAAILAIIAYEGNLAQRGLVVVPREPTDGMIEVGTDTLWHEPSHPGVVYCAMIETAIIEKLNNLK